MLKAGDYWLLLMLKAGDHHVTSENEVYKLPPPLQNDVHIVSSDIPASSSATDIRV